LAAAPAGDPFGIKLVYIVISGHCIVAANLSLDDAKELKVLCFGGKYLFTVKPIRYSGLSGWLQWTMETRLGDRRLCSVIDRHLNVPPNAALQSIFLADLGLGPGWLRAAGS